MIKSSNPAFRKEAWQREGTNVGGGTMTLNGTALKAGLLGALLVVSAAVPWHMFFSTNASVSALTPYMLVGLLGGLITAFATIYNKHLAPILSPLYAIFEGLALGAISAIFEYRYPGVAIMAIGTSFAVLGAFLFAYSTKIVRPSANFLQAVMLATGGIALYYIAALVMSLFGMHMPLMNDSGWLSIGVSIFTSLIAGLNLFIDFNFIEESCEQGAPKYMEWYGAFGIMLTMVWLYMELLRLMAKLRSR
ncbi:MAG TPA: Bax inhibitor-1/YccA family protein [Drouetiella sp.]